MLTKELEKEALDELAAEDKDRAKKIIRRYKVEWDRCQTDLNKAEKEYQRILSMEVVDLVTSEPSY